MTGLWRAIAARCDLLGLEAMPLLALGADALVLLALASMAARRLAGDDEAPARRLLASGLVLLATVVGSATALGAVGLLSNRNLVASHLALLATALVVTRPGDGASPLRWPWESVRWTFDGAAASLRELVARRGWVRPRRVESLLLLAIVLILVFYAVLAVFTLPLNHDSNAYRLSRLAYWLQEGSIRHFPTNDPRQNFVGQNAELAMLWLISFFRRGYPLVHLVQFAAGCLACLAVDEISRQVGFERRWRLAAVLTMLGVPTVAIQCFTSQTDLFTAGCLATGLSFLLPALRGGRWADWALVGAGTGLAAGAKGTVLLWGPGLVLLALAWARLERRRVLDLARGGAMLLCVALPLGGFNYVQNLAAYSNPVAPADAATQVEWAPKVSPLRRAEINAVALDFQLFDAHSNPLLPRRLLAAPFADQLAFLAARDSFYASFARSLDSTGGWLSRGLNEDEASFGLIFALVALAGGARALWGATRGAPPAARYLAAIALSTAAFLAVFGWFIRMSVHQYRYLALIVPLLSILGVFALQALRGRSGAVLVTLFLAGQCATAIEVGIESENHGLRTLIEPGRSPWYPLREEASALIRSLGDEPQRVCLGLPGDAWLAPFFRTGVANRIRTLPRGEFVEGRALAELLRSSACDSLITTPERAHQLDFRGVWVASAPDVLTRTRLVLRPADPEHPSRPTVLGTQRVSRDGWTELRPEIWLANWNSGRFTLRLDNATPLDRRVRLRSHAAARAFDLPHGSLGLVEIDVLPTDTVALDITPPFETSSPAGVRDERKLGVWLRPPSIPRAYGVFRDGWTRTRAQLRLADWNSRLLELGLGNPTDLAREVEARSAAETVRLRLAPRSTRTLALAVLPEDTVTLGVTPAYVPSRTREDSADDRELGVRLEPRPEFTTDGVSADGWTAPRASFELDHWLSGIFELRLENPTPLERTVAARASRQWVTRVVPARSATELSLAVLARDRVTLETSPAWIEGPGIAGAQASRALGMRLALPALSGNAPLLPAAWSALLPPDVAPTADHPAENEPDLPTVLETVGIDADGWTALRASFRLTHWRSESFEQTLENPTPLPRQVVAKSGRDSVRLEMAPGSKRRLTIAVRPEDRVTLEISPPYRPATGSSGVAEVRGLGILVRFHLLSETEGLFDDGWTAPRARFRLANWISGGFELDLANPTPLRREVVARSGRDAVRIELLPGATGRLVLAVRPEDEIVLEVSPPFVPSSAGGRSADPRRLGIRLESPPRAVRRVFSAPPAS